MTKSVLKIDGRTIIVSHPEGTTIKMEGGTLSTEASHRSLEKQIISGLQKEGIQWGDAVAWATAKAGIEGCASCKQRQLILNQVKSLGLKEAFRQIKDTFRGSK